MVAVSFYPESPFQLNKKAVFCGRFSIAILKPKAQKYNACMAILQNILMTLGGVTLFLLGLKFMSDNMFDLTGRKVKAVLKGVTKNRFAGVVTGTLVTAAIQSSIATNVILVGFVSAGIITFEAAAAVIMGANIGTTVTAQLVSLSGKQFFDITAFGAAICFTGFLISLLKNKKIKSVGGVMVGFGMLFFGLDIINDGVLFFKNFKAFREVFLVKNELLLLLNGVFVTALIQSSSAVTSIMIILAGNGLLSFENSMFLILGANVGTCLCVIAASINKPVEARRTAFFNFAFNLFGSLILFLPLILFKTQVAAWFASFSHGTERMIANFHTLFNLLVTAVLLPALKPFTRLISKIITDKTATEPARKRQAAKI